MSKIRGGLTCRLCKKPIESIFHWCAYWPNPNGTKVVDAHLLCANERIQARSGEQHNA